MSCDLQVEVNGQEIFYVDKKLIASFSGKLQKLFINRSTSSCKTRIDKLIFNDFPGGSQAFELIARFCYNKGEIDINPSSVFLLHYAAKFLEINEDKSKRYFETIHFWTWSDVLECLNKCQEIEPLITSSDILSKILDNLVEKIWSRHLYSSYGEDHYRTTFSDNSSSLLISSELSNCSNRSSHTFRATNWLRELEFLNVLLFEKVVNAMFTRKLHDGMICSFLFHYQKVKFLVEYVPTKRRKILEIVVNSLCLLDKAFDFPLRTLFDLLRTCNKLKMEKRWRRKLEKMIGSKLDEATLDDMMVRCSNKRNTSTCSYDVSLILRLLKTFLRGSSEKFFLQRLKRVARLIDLYLAEVAPDKRLKPGAFLELVVALPDIARETHDRLFEVIDLYFKVHRFISEEDKIKLSSILNYDKLSIESLSNLSKDLDFPDSTTTIASKCFDMVSSKGVEGAQTSFGLSLSADEDEQLLKCSKVQTRSANLAKICLKNRKSLPRLCS